MRRAVRFVVALVIAHGLVASAIVHQTTRACALATALSLSVDEQRDRMRSMRAFLSDFNVYRWAGRMLADAARLRSRDRLTGRLTDHLGAAAAR